MLGHRPEDLDALGQRQIEAAEISRNEGAEEAGAPEPVDDGIGQVAELLGLRASVAITGPSSSIRRNAAFRLSPTPHLPVATVPA